MAQTTPFDLVLLLIIAEAVQQALLGDDFSVTNALVLIVVLIGADIVMSVLKEHMPLFEKVVDGEPVILVEHGAPIRDRMNRARVDEEDVLAAARQSQGLRRMDEIEFAVLERDGAISIIPRRDAT